MDVMQLRRNLLMMQMGGENVQIYETDVTLQSTSEYLSFPCSFEPDIAAIYVENYPYDSPIDGVVGMVVHKGYSLGYKRYNGSGYSYSHTGSIDPETYPYGTANGNGLAGGSYSNGTLTMRARGPGAAYQWNSSNKYHCVAIKLDS